MKTRGDFLVLCRWVTFAEKPAFEWNFGQLPRKKSLILFYPWWNFQMCGWAKRFQNLGSWRGLSSSRDRWSENHLFCGHRGAHMIMVKPSDKRTQFNTPIMVNGRKAYTSRWSHECWKSSFFLVMGSGIGNTETGSLWVLCGKKRSTIVFQRPYISPPIPKDEETILLEWFGCGGWTGLLRCSAYLGLYLVVRFNAGVSVQLKIS